LKKITKGDAIMTLLAFNDGVEGLGVALGFLGIYLLIMTVCCLFYAIVTWKIFVKMGEPGWKCLIPFYSNYIMCKHTWGQGIWFLAWFIPGIGSIPMLITYFLVFKGFGWSTGKSIVGVLLSAITLPIVAFNGDTFTDQTIG
jgi:hypothetical protein